MIPLNWDWGCPAPPPTPRPIWLVGSCTVWDVGTRLLSPRSLPRLWVTPFGLRSHLGHQISPGIRIIIPAIYSHPDSKEIYNECYRLVSYSGCIEQKSCRIFHGRNEKKEKNCLALGHIRSLSLVYGRSQRISSPRGVQLVGNTDFSSLILRTGEKLSWSLFIETIKN